MLQLLECSYIYDPTHAEIFNLQCTNVQDLYTIQDHADAIKRICRYLQATQDKGLDFTLSIEIELDCYVDADFAGL